MNVLHHLAVQHDALAILLQKSHCASPYEEERFEEIYLQKRSSFRIIEQVKATLKKFISEKKLPL